MIPLAIAAAAALYFWPGVSLGIFWLDDGAPVYGAWRVLSGDVPYRDFTSVYAPGGYYALAALFKLFGTSVMVERAFTALCLAGTCGLAAHLASRRAGRRAAILTGLFATAWIGRFGHLPGPQAPAVFLALASGAVLLSALDSPSFRRFAAAGALAGAAALFRQDTGAAALAAAALALALHGRKGILPFASGAAAALLPVAAYFLSVVPARELHELFVAHPAGSYAGVAWLPYPNPLRAFAAFVEGRYGLSRWASTVLSQAPYVFVPLVVASSAAACAFKARRFPERVWLTALGAVLFVPAAVRPDDAHLFPAFSAAAVLAAYFVLSSGRALRVAAFAAAALVLADSAGLKAFHALTEMDARLFSPPRGRGVTVSTIDLRADRSARDYENAIAYVREHVPAGGRIFVGSSRHDRLCLSDPLFYFLAERHSGTRQHELYRGIAVTEAAQREIVDDLERSRVDVAVLRAELDDFCVEPNASRRAGGSKLLDEYLKERFETAARFGPNVVLKRREGGS